MTEKLLHMYYIRVTEGKHEKLKKGKMKVYTNFIILYQEVTRKDIKFCTTKHRTITDSHNGSNNEQKVNDNGTTALKWTAA